MIPVLPALGWPLSAGPASDGPALTREGAREAARRELAKPPYHRDSPGLAERALRAVGRWVSELFDRAAAAGPGSRIGVIFLVLLLVVVIVAVRLRVGPLDRRSATPAALLSAATRTPEQYRARATEAARSGDYAKALRDRLRAVAREVEVRGVLEPRAGRTAEELIRELAAALPGLDDRLPAAVDAFAAVWYGGRTALAADYDLAVAADQAVRAGLGYRRAVDPAAGLAVVGASAAGSVADHAAEALSGTADAADHRP